MLSGVFEKSMLPDVQEKQGKIKNNFNLKLLSGVFQKEFIELGEAHRSSFEVL